MTEQNLVKKINEKINVELTNETKNALLKTTFNGLSEIVMRQALMEGMLRGFEFKDFLEKNVYAIPFGQKYSLVTSIDYARKIAMKNGQIGKTSPAIEFGKDNEVVSCSVTITKLLNGVKGDFTAKVYFSEYSTGRNLWKTKPVTMISKVAEMHALRMAFPEDLSQMYEETEMEKAVIDVEDITEEIIEKKKEVRGKLEACKTREDVVAVYKEFAGSGEEVMELITEKGKEFVPKKEDEEVNKSEDDKNS